MSKKHNHKHHRKPRSLGGDNSSRNRSIVDRDKHNAWHLLFKNHPPERIALIINNVWLDPDYIFVVVRKDML
jgi:hypothetical protein